MAEEPTSILAHVSLGTNDFDRASEFYDATLATLGIVRIMVFPDAIGFGKSFPEFWIQTPYDGGTATVGNGAHVAFAARNRDEVHAFFDAAIKAGGTSDGPPGPRPEYGAPYYGCFIRDLDGNKIEATFWDAELAQES